MQTPRIVVITATRVVAETELFLRLERARDLPAGMRARMAVQLRDPELEGAELWRLGQRLRDVTRSLGISLVVNDRVDLAVALAADGVHLGRRSVSARDVRALAGADVWISRSCHAPEEVVEAARAGADVAVLSPIFASPGKGDPLSPEAIRRARSLLQAAGLFVPVLALGGVDATNAAACFEVGAAGIMAIRADLVAAARALFAGESGSG